MSSKAKKAKKLKPHGASNTAGSLSILFGLVLIFLTLGIFIFFLMNDGFFEAIKNMDQGLLVILLPFLIIVLVVWGIIKLVLGGFMLSWMWGSAVLFFICGGMMKTASANLGNIYSNKSNRKRAKASMIMWWVIIVLLAIGIYVTNKITGAVTNSEGFKKICYGVIGVFMVLAFICFLIACIDFVVKSKSVKYNEQGQMIDETYASSVVAFSEDNVTRADKTQKEIVCASCGSKINSDSKFCPNCGYKNETEPLKIGDVTSEGKVIGFNVNTNEPVFMPVDKTEDEPKTEE